MQTNIFRAARPSSGNIYGHRGSHRYPAVVHSTFRSAILVGRGWLGSADYVSARVGKVLSHAAVEALTQPGKDVDLNQTELGIITVRIGQRTSNREQLEHEDHSTWPRRGHQPTL